MVLPYNNAARVRSHVSHALAVQLMLDDPIDRRNSNASHRPRGGPAAGLLTVGCAAVSLHLYSTAKDNIIIPHWQLFPVPQFLVYSERRAKVDRTRRFCHVRNIPE